MSSLRNFSKKLKKFSKFQPKTHKTVPQRIQKCLEHVLGHIFRKIFAHFSMEGRVFENFQKNQKKFKIPKRPKIVPKSIQKCLEHVLGQIFRKILPSFPWRVESSKIFKKIPKIFKVPKKPKIVTKSIQTSSERVLGQFFRKTFAQCSMDGRVFENFQKKFQNSKNAQNRSQKHPNVFWTCFGAIFSKIFCPVFHGWSSFQKFSKISKKFQNSKNAQNRSQKYSNVFWTSFGANFSQNFCPVFHGVSSLRNFSKKLKKFSKFQPKTHKTVPKRIQKYLEHVLGQIFRKIFAQFSMEVRVFENFQKNTKNFQSSKKAENRYQKYPNEFWTCFGAIFSKNFCPVFHGGSSLRKFSKKYQKFSKFQKSRKSLPKVSKRVLNLFWGKFFPKYFLPSVPWRLETSKSWKKPKNSQFSEFAQNRTQKYPNVFWTCFGANFLKNFMPSNPRRVESSKIFKNIKQISKFQKKPKIVPKSIQTCFEQVLGQIFRKFFAQFSMECRVFETFQKNSKNFQNSNQKRTKPFPKESKSVWNMFWGIFFEKFLPIFPWKVESSKIFKKIKKSLKFQKGPKSFPKVSKSVWNMFWGKFFEKFLPSFPWRVESSKIFKKIPKIFKVPKKPKIVTKSIQASSERVLGQFFRKTFAQCSMDGRVFENFQKKYFQNSKNAQNCSQKHPNVFWTCFGAIFSKIFCPVFHGWSSFQKFSKISKKFQNSKNAQNRSQKYSNVFWTSFGANFSQNFCPVFHGGLSLRNFSKKLKKFSKFQPKTHKTVPKRIQKYLEHVLGQIFRKIFAQFSMEGRVFENFQKNTKNFQSSKKAENRYQKYPNEFWTCFGAIFSKNFCPVFHGGSSLRKFSKKYQKFSKFQKSRKSLPKVSKRVLNLFWGKFFPKYFLPSVPWRVESSKIFKKIPKIFKVPKKPKIVTKSVQTCFELVLGQIFPKIIFAQCSMEARDF